MSKDLQNEFKRISDALNDLNIRRAKAEANLENLHKQKEEALERVMTLAKANSLEDVKDKLGKLEDKLEVLRQKAEEILNDQ